MRSPVGWAAIDPSGVRHLGWHMTWCDVHCDDKLDPEQMAPGWRSERIMWADVMEGIVDVCTGCIAVLVAMELNCA